MTFDDIRKFKHCASKEERKQKFGVALISILLWPIFIVVLALVVFFSYGLALIIFLINWMFAEYHVRKIQAVGVSVSSDQFPEIWEAAESVRERFQIHNPPHIIILAHGELNAFAVRIARKRLIILFSELLEGIIDQPAELRALLAHEMCHHSLDFGWSRRILELYKPAKFRSARELTCDNASLVAAQDIDAAKSLLRKLSVGTKLHTRVSDPALVDEAIHINSGFYGWLLRQYLSHPPVGARISNLDRFANRNTGLKER